MAEVKNDSISQAYPMSGGHGLYSYAKNSTYQKGAIDAFKELIHETIHKSLDLHTLSLPKSTLRVVDMGCSSGPNTFFAVGNIIEALKHKYQLQGIQPESLEFQVFFNDHPSNDFNTLFTSLPPNRQYYAAGVPGSFYGRLFPNSSLAVVYSSNALHWLSKVPEEVVDKNSPAWNKGRIICSSEGAETAKAYSNQFAKDMDRFLHFRAQEVLYGGFVIIVVPGRFKETSHSQVDLNIFLHLLGSCLVDMAKKGIISEEKVDHLNIPAYIPSPEELENAVFENGCFSIEKLECLPTKIPTDDIEVTARRLSSHFRAGLALLLKDHFEQEIMDELFDSFTKKLENPAVYQPGASFNLIAILRRKTGEE